MKKIIDFNINDEIPDIDTIYEIEESCRNNRVLTKEKIELLLSTLSYTVRKRIADYDGKDMETYSYPFTCDLAQSMTYYYLKNIGIAAKPLNIIDIIKDITDHSIVLAKIKTKSGEKLYLIDPTYIQFFNKDKCTPYNFVIIKDTVCVTPDPGYFILKNHTEDIIKPLLENGYIEFTEEVAKAYGDAFFQTKKGVSFDEIENNATTGHNYLKWFTNHTSKLSKTEEELDYKQLLIDSLGEENEIMMYF